MTWTVHPRRPCGAGMLFLLPFLAAPAAAQQFVVDDAGTVGRAACQVEGWVGEGNSWLLPACRLHAGPEVTLGLGSVREDPDSRTLEWVLQGKFPVRDPEEEGWGWSVVAGVGGDPLAQVTGRHPRSAFAYVPFTVQASAAALHLNLGWFTELDGAGADRSHAATWGIRGDVEVRPRFAVIGELAGEGGERPLWQVGVRLPLLPELLLVDVSWGGRGEGERSGSGWAVGAAWTPPPLR